jgi:hypothetical protein
MERSAPRLGDKDSKTATLAPLQNKSDASGSTHREVDIHWQPCIASAEE